MPRRTLVFLLEPLDGRSLFAASAPIPLPTTVLPAAITTRSIYLTGNSMTDGVNYAGLAALLSRGGTSVSLGRQTGPGYSQWQNFNLVPGYNSSGINPANPADTNPYGKYTTAFANKQWDILTLQLHERRLFNDIYNPGTPTEHNEAEIPATLNFLRLMAANNPKGQVFIYSRAARRTDINADLTPTGQPFDYSAEWLKAYDDSAANHLAFFSRSAVTQTMPLIRTAAANDSATASLPKVKLIPVGEAYYNIDQALKAGKFAGTSVTSIYDLYRDQSHPTADVAAYVIGLTFFSSITGTDPRGITPPGQYLGAGSKLTDTKVQALLQQAVYDAITSPYYAGYTTTLSGTPTPTNSARISGFTFNDADRSGTFNAGDSLAVGKTVFLDADNDGLLDAGEKSVVTDANGNYAFTGLAAGTYRVRRVFPTGYGSSTPLINLTLTDGQVVAGQAIGSVSNPTPPPPPTGSSAIYRGYVINDTNGDGKWNNGEKGLVGRSVWIDLDNDGVKDSTEPTSVTGTNGLFEFKNLAAGAIYVREVLPTGWKQTSPTSNKPLTATFTTGQTKSGQYFAVKQA